MCLVVDNQTVTVSARVVFVDRTLQVSNPRRACAARVSRLSVVLSVTTFSATTRNKAAKKRYQRVQCHTGLIYKMRKSTAFKSSGVKAFSAITRNKAAKKRYQRVQCHTGLV